MSVNTVVKDADVPMQKGASEPEAAKVDIEALDMTSEAAVTKLMYALGKTKDMKEVCLSADILVAAVGKAGFVTADMVKEGAIVVDVGINRLEDGSLVGDVDFEEVK